MLLAFALYPGVKRRIRCVMCLFIVHTKKVQWMPTQHPLKILTTFTFFRLFFMNYHMTTHLMSRIQMDDLIELWLRVRSGLQTISGWFVFYFILYWLFMLELKNQNMNKSIVNYYILKKKFNSSAYEILRYNKR